MEDGVERVAVAAGVAATARPWSRRDRRSLAWVAFAAAALAALLATWSRAARGIDDVQITFVFARSFAEGLGLTWNGARVLGTSSPFLALVLGSAARLTGLSVVRLGIALCWAAIAATPPLLFLVGRREEWRAAAVAVGMLWVLAAPLLQLGGEYPVAVAAMLAAAVALLARRPAWAGLCLAVAGALRAEVLLAAPLLAMAHVLRFRERSAFREVARSAAVAVTVMALWLVVLGGLTHAVVPRTLSAKRAQATSALGIWKPQPALERARARPAVLVYGSPPAAYFFFAALGGLALALRARRSPTAVALVAWGVLHLRLIQWLGVPVFPWYLTPYAFAALLVAGFAAELPLLLGGWRRGVAAAALVAAAVWALEPSAARLPKRYAALRDYREGPYQHVGQLIAEYPPQVRAAAYEVGILGWWSHRPVLDLLGLVTPSASLDAVRHGDLAENLRDLDPDLLMVPLATGSLVYVTLGQPRAFLSRYELDDLSGESGKYPVALYRRRGLDGLGNVVADALPRIAESGRVSRIGQAGTGMLAIVLGGSEQLDVPVPPGAAAGYLEVALAADGGGADAAIGSGAVIWRAPARRGAWSWVEPSGLDGARLPLQLRCEAPRGVHCFFGQPHWRRRVDRRGPTAVVPRSR